MQININKKTYAHSICRFAVFAAAMCLTACAQTHEEYTDSDALPLATQYSAEVQSVRENAAYVEAASSNTEAVSAFTEQTFSDSETVNSPLAASADIEDNADESDTRYSSGDQSSDANIIDDSDGQGSTAQSNEEIITEASVPMADVPDTEVAETVPPATPEQAIQTSFAAAEQQTADPDQVGYDKSFFENTLFIGDSITTGYSLYGYIDDKNVYAKIGLNPSTVLTKSVSTCYGEITIGDMLDYTQPDIVYIMLGSNGIQWLSCENMISSTGELVDIIEEHCPDAFIVLVSVPPVTADYDSTVDIDVMEKILEYNRKLWDYADEHLLGYIDITGMLTDDTGYFNKGYAEYDGMHFKPDAYKAVLSELQTVTEEYLYQLNIAFGTDENDVSSIVTEPAETASAAQPESEAQEGEQQ